MSKTGEWEKVGVIGVDAGLCLIGDPCYCVIKYVPGGLTPGLGVTVSTGHGDGEYPVYVRRNKEGRIIEARVVFIDEEEKS